MLALAHEVPPIPSGGIALVAMASPKLSNEQNNALQQKQ
jgi:hypothetical protein